jgi:hypothetical protein
MKGTISEMELSVLAGSNSRTGGRSTAGAMVGCSRPAGLEAPRPGARGKVVERPGPAIEHWVGGRLPKPALVSDREVLRLLADHVRARRKQTSARWAGRLHRRLLDHLVGPQPDRLRDSKRRFEERPMPTECSAQSFDFGAPGAARGVGSAPRPPDGAPVPASGEGQVRFLPRPRWD